jgi:uncharacterized membrane protein
MSALRRGEWAFLALIVIYSFIPAVVGLFRVPELFGGLALVPQNARALSAPTPIVLHILSSSLFCLLGAVQFLPSVRRRHAATHRNLGRLVAAAGCLSALSGLWMTLVFTFPPALQGPLLFWVRIAVGGAMVGFIVRAVVAIRARDTAVHRAAMLRAYAIGQGASTQALLFLTALAVFGTELVGLQRDVAMTMAWAINMIAAEGLIRRVPAPRTKPTRAAQRSSRSHPAREPQ